MQRGLDIFISPEKEERKFTQFVPEINDSEKSSDKQIVTFWINFTVNSFQQYLQ